MIRHLNGFAIIVSLLVVIANVPQVFDWKRVDGNYFWRVTTMVLSGQWAPSGETVMSRQTQVNAQSKQQSLALCVGSNHPGVRAQSYVLTNGQARSFKARCRWFRPRNVRRLSPRSLRPCQVFFFRLPVKPAGESFAAMSLRLSDKVFVSL